MTKPVRVTLPETGAAGALRDTAVSHIGFRVPDVPAAVQFYATVLGLVVQEELPDGGARLGWGTGHHVVDLVPGEKALDHIAFEVRDAGGLDAIAARLSSCTELDESYVDHPLGKVRGISTIDPDGNTVHFHSAVYRQGENAADTGRRPIKYQHVTLATSDVARMAEFYVGTVGFRISDQLADGGFAWLRSNRDHHTLAVVGSGQRGLDHYSYDLAEWEDFKAWCDRLTDIGVDVVWGPGRHGPGNNLFVFFDDPAGNHIELSAEMEKFHDDRVEYVPRRWEPVPNSVNLWGGQLAKWRHTSEGK